MKVGDLTTVFLSYDEPWADDNWEDLRSKAPKARRVHGVTGLDACHKAAARASDTDWFITVDADTRVDPAFFDQEIPDALLNDSHRLDWYSRNAVNGLVAGNGCLKIWPRKLVQDMRTHEAAEGDDVSLDHEITKVAPGESLQVPMPGCFSVTDPANTPYHAFRAGFREGVFLSSLRDEIMHPDSPTRNNRDDLGWYLRIWCSLGAHAENGLWAIYGARLGIWRRHISPRWDIRQTIDYKWFNAFWDNAIYPRFSLGGQRCRDTWDADLLRAEISQLGLLINHTLTLEIEDYAPEESLMIAQAQLFPSLKAPHRIDWVGRQFLLGKGVNEDVHMARQYFDIAAAMGHPAAFLNLARLHHTGRIEGSDRDAARRLYERSVELGNMYAPYHLATLLREDGDTSERPDALVELARARGYDPGAVSAA